MTRHSRVDLSNCELEPIHVPGAVQPYSVLLAGDLGGLVISHISANAEELFGRPAKDLCGQNLEEVLPAEVIHEIGNAELSSDSPMRPGLLFGLQIPSAELSLDAAVHHYDGRRILELQPDESKSSAFANSSPLTLVSYFASNLQSSRSVEDLWNAAASSAQHLLGFDRVMVYKFHEDGSGEVVAESMGRKLGPFLGLRFPASDIPRQARDLYKRNLTRVIADVNAAPVPILAVGAASDRPLDLSHSIGRAVSPIHIEYLRNMDVGASMSISILVGGRLWGLIACHHCTGKSVSLRTRSAAQLFAQFFSAQLEAMERTESFDALYSARDRIDSVTRKMSSHGSVFSALTAHSDELRSVLRADGVAVLMDGELEVRGETPPTNAILELAQLLVGRDDGRVLATNALSQTLPAADACRESASGMLAIPFARKSGDFLLFFRKEVYKTVRWAGDPNVPAQHVPGSQRLTPRASFAVWKEQRRGQSAPWTPTDKLLAETVRISLIQARPIARQADTTDPDQQSETRDLLIGELNHRVKNILALISALVSKGRDSEATLEEYVQALDGRIRALAFAHDHITRRSVSSFRSLLESEASPFAGTGAVLEVDGPSLTFDSHAFPSVALVVHELITNAAKYGALSVGEGRLEVRWSRRADGDLEVEWREKNGPEVVEPSRRGFGSVLIERSIPFDLGGKTSIRHPPTGVEVDLLIPAQYLVEAEERDYRPTPTVTEMDGLSGYEVIVVEDQIMIALNAQMMLENLGAARVETARNAEKALELITDSERPLAVLDFNLGATTSMDLAAELQDRKVPFIFATGYTNSAVIPLRFQNVPVAKKPYGAEDLREALTKVIEAAEPGADV